VTIRLLDPPLHEFLPRDDEEIAEIADRSGCSHEKVRAAVERHLESNPMLGQRGVRLAVTHPEITEMQVRAILQAALDVASDGIDVHPEIMVPLVMCSGELEAQHGVVDRVAREVFQEDGRRVDYSLGTMIELPRAALLAGALAERADFFSFGTNDLTQTTLGLSRDDAAGFLPLYVAEGHLAHDPFRRLDEDGVGRLIRMACDEGRRARPDLWVGVCGEHAGDPDSVAFFHSVGADYVSCSPFRVPGARLAAARAVLDERARREGRSSSPRNPGDAPEGGRPARRATRGAPTSGAGVAHGPIGRVENAFAEPTDPETLRAATSRIVLDPEMVDGLEGIEAGCRVLVVFWFHRSRGWELLQHPRGDASRPRRGVFALHSPHRPNPIGVTVVDVLAVRGNVLDVKGLDAIDGTPVLDLKSA
jgi:tRNA-Thr(GGU) m(6)t(6)A37 methyltransferase TsaA